MRGDLVTELVELINAYQWRWAVVHGDHGVDCELCRGLHERHAWALAAMSVDHRPEPELQLEEAVA